jgi:phosphoenolpyruvate-protein phosphotransferase/dihydroxyacetone kinase phosphotransfer subunit
MVGIVIVSHSAGLAKGVVELAREMGGADVPIESAGGLDLPDQPLGTDAALVLRAIEAADSEDGVLVLMDLGSAVLSAEMAVEMLPPERRDRVRLCEAPLVEGAVAAAATARIGGSLDQVAQEARGGLQAKAAHLGVEEAAAPAGSAPTVEGKTVRLQVRNRLGLHARPAARFVQTAGMFGAEIAVTNATTGSGPASARSLNALATLGVRQGHEVDVTASGPQADEALAALSALAERDFDDVEPTPVEPPSEVAPAAAEGALAGLPASPGIALGPARELYVPLGSPMLIYEAGDPPSEWAHLQTALGQVKDEIAQTREEAAARVGEYEAAIFDAHLLFLEDETLLEPTRRAIFEGQEDAPSAWSAATEEAASAYEALNDPYLQARAADVRDVAQRVIDALRGRVARPSLRGDGIVVARDLSPAETIGLDPDQVRGIATAFGGPTSHGAILARALGIPAVVGLGSGVLEIREGTPLALDGEAGLLVPEPSPELIAEYEDRQAEAEVAASEARAAAVETAVTSDLRRIEVFANVGSPRDVAAAVAAGAEGVGLFRTEFLFLERDSLPDEEEQYRAYREAAEALEGRPLILRTLDVGADKPLPTLPQPHEANPFLGVRGIRLGLEQPELLATQLRAAVRVAEEFPLKIMFPMVATLREWEEARQLVDVAGAPEGLEVGVMIEVPAAALSADALVAGGVDFFSIGTNDLTQYTMAAERGNERVAGLGDALHPAVLRLIARVTAAAEPFGNLVGVCGELAGDPAATPVLVGLGVTELSMSAPAIPRIKQAVRALDAGAARGLAEAALLLESGEEVRRLVAAETAAPR